MSALITLNQLYYVLATKPDKEKITREESSAIAECHLKVLWNVGLATGAGGGLAWQVAKRLKMLKGLGRFIVAAGAASASLTVAFDWANSTTAVSCLDHILRQDATRIQRELVNILVRNNRNEPWRLQLMSKHFYPEALYSDEGDKPQMRWRKRSGFTEVASSYDDAKPQRNRNALPNPPNPQVSIESDASNSKPMLQHSSGNLNGQEVEEEEEDALDIVFGNSETRESSPAPVNSKGSSKTLTRKQKRAQRRERIKNREASSINTPQYELA